jgi:ABC-type Mn2+/Zn2+ transport system ATPase subunit
VFLHDKCPQLLLIDETFAPLDPESKSLVMGKLKRFCSNSVVLVIYHADVQVEELGDNMNGNSINNEDVCVPSSNFFDDNLHVDNGTFILRAVCMDSM